MNPHILRLYRINTSVVALMNIPFQFDMVIRFSSILM